MAYESLITETTDFIQARLIHSKKKFEILYSSTRDLQRKSELLKTIDEIDRDLKKLHAGVLQDNDLKKYEIAPQDLQNYLDNVNKPKKSAYRILRNIIVEKLNTNSSNIEINSIWTYLNYFGKEYLGLLSEQNLRLDYGHAYQRDKFYTYYTQTVRVLEEYGKTLDQIEAANSSNNRDYKDRLIKVQGKEYRDVIMKTGQFLHAIRAFIEDILESEKTGEKNLLEPDKIVEIKGENSSIEGLPAKKALMDLYDFIKEFIDYLKIPDLKKIEEEDLHK
jgi:hypothetical protein